MKKIIFAAAIATILLTGCLNEETNKRIKNAIDLKKDTVLRKKVTAINDKAVINFASMENPPTYPGGMRAFYSFIGNNLNYPPEAVENNIKGSVLMSFMIDKEGKIQNVKVDRGLGYGTDEEAIRVLQLSPKWSPGVSDGKPVNVKYNLPIKFSLN